MCFSLQEPNPDDPLNKGGYTVYNHSHFLLSFSLLSYFNQKAEESEKASSCRELNPRYLACAASAVVLCQGQLPAFSLSSVFASKHLYSNMRQELSAF